MDRRMRVTLKSAGGKDPEDHFESEHPCDIVDGGPGVGEVLRSVYGGRVIRTPLARVKAVHEADEQGGWHKVDLASLKVGQSLQTEIENNAGKARVPAPGPSMPKLPDTVQGLKDLWDERHPDEDYPVEDGKKATTKAALTAALSAEGATTS